jgi:hypothetical protein
MVVIYNMYVVIDIEVEGRFLKYAEWDRGERTVLQRYQVSFTTNATTNYYYLYFIFQ